MWSRRIKLSPVHDRSYRDWSQRSVIVEYAVQRSLCPNNNLAVDLCWRINAFSPLPFNSAVDAQRIYGTHRVNLAGTLLRENSRDLRSLGERSRGDLEGSMRSSQIAPELRERRGWVTAYSAYR